MKIAVASGKGGTGKTLIATNLAYLARAARDSVAYLDGDVEEPNGALFLKPRWQTEEPVTIPVPHIEKSKCTSCGQCEQICQYSAIVMIAGRIMVSNDLCHGCGGCSQVCPAQAIVEKEKVIGKVNHGRADGIHVIQGTLDIGHPLSPPIIKAVKAQAPVAGLVIIDAPPGTSCPAVEAVKDADYVTLVTEPTPFGLNDLKLAVDMLRALKKPFGVVVNKKNSYYYEVQTYCQQEQIEILAELQNDRHIAEHYSRNELIVRTIPGYRQVMEKLFNKIMEAAGQNKK